MVGSTDPGETGRESHGEQGGEEAWGAVGGMNPKEVETLQGGSGISAGGPGVSLRPGNCSTHTCLCAFTCEFILVAQCQVEMKEVGVTL